MIYELFIDLCLIACFAAVVWIAASLFRLRGEQMPDVNGLSFKPRTKR